MWKKDSRLSFFFISANISNKILFEEIDSKCCSNKILFEEFIRNIIRIKFYSKCCVFEIYVLYRVLEKGSRIFESFLTLRCNWIWGNFEMAQNRISSLSPTILIFFTIIYNNLTLILYSNSNFLLFLSLLDLIL